MYERTKNYRVHVLPGKQLNIEQIAITDTKKEKITEPTVQFVSQGEVMKFISQYYSALELAFNGNGFSMVQTYYDSIARFIQIQKRTFKMQTVRT